MNNYLLYFLKKNLKKKILKYIYTIKNEKKFKKKIHI